MVAEYLSKDLDKVDIANSADIERRGRIESLFYTGSSLYMQLYGSPPAGNLKSESEIHNYSPTQTIMKHLSVTFRVVILVVLVVIVVGIVITIRKKLGGYQKAEIKN